MSRAGQAPKGTGVRGHRIDKGPLDGREAGQVAHVLIGELLVDGVRAPTPEELFVRVGRHPSTQGPVVYRQAARQRLRTAVALYFRLFIPPPDWDFVGAEVRARGCRFDLVWKRPDERIVVDELKTGHVKTGTQQTDLTRQVARLRTAGKAKYGDRFLGVRVCLLASPRLSYFAHPDGTNQPLEDFDESA